MRHSLHSHIIYLENTIQDLRNRLTSSRLTIDEVQDFELQLTLAESALEHYRQAYELELSVSGSEPPEGPPDKTGSVGTDRREKSSSEKKKEGLAAVEMRARKRHRGAQLREMSHLESYGAKARRHVPMRESGATRCGTH